MEINSNIIDFAEAKPRRMFRMVGLKRALSCAHWQLVIDERSRTLACKDCGSIIEPFNWLLNVARRADSFDTQHRALRVEIERAKKTLDAVHRELRKAERRRDGLKQEVAELSKQLRIEFGLPEVELQRIKERLR
ncbi:hypothetical protein [Methylocaldum sp.]|uniref:hypothetical protein n=1 Tax=Methylocaldum sp. TaxID=1969727 RepID=UPI002D2BDB58|nr:hypothetical protein [Methylocaldum sp.]HYE35479.1 hypothetical protein [Methylocaldum sp.]